jgi:hypothetical protein
MEFASLLPLTPTLSPLTRGEGALEIAPTILFLRLFRVLRGEAFIFLCVLGGEAVLFLGVLRGLSGKAFFFLRVLRVLGGKALRIVSE